jgi:lipopolysaccharide export system permease protein
VNPRSGRGNNMILAIFIFLVYNNLMTLSQNWVQTGIISLSSLMLALHGGVFAAGLLWLFKRHLNLNVPRWARWPAWRKGEATA